MLNLPNIFFNLSDESKQKYFINSSVNRGEGERGGSQSPKLKCTTFTLENKKKSQNSHFKINKSKEPSKTTRKSIFCINLLLLITHHAVRAKWNECLMMPKIRNYNISNIENVNCIVLHDALLFSIQLTGWIKSQVSVHDKTKGGIALHTHKNTFNFMFWIVKFSEFLIIAVTSNPLSNACWIRHRPVLAVAPITAIFIFVTEYTLRKKETKRD